MSAKKKAAAKRPNKTTPCATTASRDGALFDRVATILEQSRANVVRAVNHHMVLAYWLIGKEIVQEIQNGGERASYGKQVIAGLSTRLASRYGRGFSSTNLRYSERFTNYLLTVCQRSIARRMSQGQFFTIPAENRETHQFATSLVANSKWHQNVTSRTTFWVI